VKPGWSGPVEHGDGVRPAQFADAPEVAELLTELGYPCDAAEAQRRLLELEDDPRQSVMVAERGGLVCGLLGLEISFQLPLGMPACRITVLVVGRGQQRSGVGRQLLAEAETRARFSGATRIEVSSAAARHGAHAFYREAGYRDGSVRFVKVLGDA